MRVHYGLRIRRCWSPYGGVFHGREKIYVSPAAVPDACLVLDLPYWLVQVGQGLAAVSGTAAMPWEPRRYATLAISTYRHLS